MPDAPAVPRHAASLLLVRETPGGPAVLMGQRGAGHRFMPNRLVFPGGAVDEADFSAPAAAALRPEVALRLEAAAEPALARALAAAVAREFFEETGLTLGTPPRLDVLDYLCRAVTPPVSPMRFDARFFVADAAAAAGTLAGSGELEDLRFIPVEEALALDLANVTRGVLQQLLSWLALSPAARAARTRTPLRIEGQWQDETWMEE